MRAIEQRYTPKFQIGRLNVTKMSTISKSICNSSQNPTVFFPPRAEQADYKMNMNVQNDNEQPVWGKKMRKPAILKMTVT